jgi:hypothetical protein
MKICYPYKRCVPFAGHTPCAYLWGVYLCQPEYIAEHSRVSLCNALSAIGSINMCYDHAHNRFGGVSMLRFDQLIKAVIIILIIILLVVALFISPA